MKRERLQIVIVEDEAAHAEAISRAFITSGAKTEIQVAGTLEEYRQVVVSNPPDIVLMDLNMPDGRALDLLATQAEPRPFPILIMTSHGNEQTAVEALKSGALDYVVKSREAFAAMPHIVTRALREWRLIQGHQRMEETLLASEAKYRFLHESMMDAFARIDMSGKIVECNSIFLNMLGYSEEESRLLDYMDITPASWHADEARIIEQQVLTQGYSDVYEKEYRRKDGTLIPVELRTNLLKDDDGKPSGMWAIIRDITERKKLEEQLLQAQKMESIGTLAGGIAHDFNNILTAIIGYGHLVLMSMEPDNPQRLNIEHMLEASNRAANLTQDLLIFSRKQIGNKRPVDLNETVKTVEKFLTRVIGEDIDCRITVYCKPLVVLADTHQLEQVLMNLATNARDAMPQGGDLIISVGVTALDKDFANIHGYGKRGIYALLTVSDTGEGIDETTRRKIFEPFFTTKEVGKGTGLGLAVVYGIIKQHDGFINVYSEPGIGTTFKIYLPVISSALPAVEKAPEEEILTRGTETILIAEDNEPARNFISILLRQEGYTVIEAVDGTDAIQWFMKNRDTIQLLIFDLIMPKMGGKEAYDQIKAIRSDVKVIIVSGYAPDIIRQKMLVDSSVELLYKPIVPHTLLKKVRAVLDQCTP
ncbi:MAG: response regulator [Desulfuromonadales bacterium]|nr:response regulator [Desulfuromonadales bacterium]